MISHPGLFCCSMHGFKNTPVNPVMSLPRILSLQLLVSAWVSNLIPMLSIIDMSFNPLTTTHKCRLLRKGLKSGWWGICKILIEMGPYGSIWSHTLRIRSHMGYKGSGMAKMGLGFHIISNYSLDVGFKTFSQKTSKIWSHRSSDAGTTNLS